MVIPAKDIAFPKKSQTQELHHTAIQRQYSAGGDTEEWQMQDANLEVRKNTVGDGKLL
jgi:hypothetical protein